MHLELCRCLGYSLASLLVLFDSSFTFFFNFYTIMVDS